MNFYWGGGLLQRCALTDFQKFNQTIVWLLVLVGLLVHGDITHGDLTPSGRQRCTTSPSFTLDQQNELQSGRTSKYATQT